MNPLEIWALSHGVSRHALDELKTLFLTAVSVPGEGSETTTQGMLRVAAPKVGASLWRNNSGATMDDSGRLIRYGLANDSKKLNEVFKSSDLIGITPVEWYGRTFGVFTAVECKRPDWAKPENDRDRAQLNFGMTVESMGGIFMFATHVDQYLKRVGK